MANNFPEASDVVLHAKDSDTTERIIFPITRYSNIMHAPKMINSVTGPVAAPFLLLKETMVEIEEEELHKLTNALN